jgi:hypothetical protein
MSTKSAAARAPGQLDEYERRLGWRVMDAFALGLVLELRKFGELLRVKGYFAAVTSRKEVGADSNSLRVPL